MRRSIFFSIVALLVAAIGVVIALAAYFRYKKTDEYEDFDEDLLMDDYEDLDYYASEIDAEGPNLEEIVQVESGMGTPDDESGSSES